jgi:hypothetical protein
MATPEHRTPIPKAPFWLTAGGLIPFVVIAGAMWALPAEFTQPLVAWLTAYAAVTLSFAGGLHWGLSMLHPDMTEQDQSVFMAWSVVPAVVGWISLLMLPKTALLLLTATFVIQYAADRQLAQRFRLPSWHLRLRAGLTAVAILCLVLARIHLART